MEIKHGGCWYCGSKSQPILKAMQKTTIGTTGSETKGGYAVCDECAKVPVLDQRIPVEQRRR